MSASGPGGREATQGAHDSDAGRLAALGYESHFSREMSPWANFSLGFTYLSPVVGIYTLFGFALATGGPPMIWSLLVVGTGQLLVALVFGEIVSQYPIAGGVYPWARRLWGRRWAWMTGWVYLIALLVTIAAVSYGAGPYLSILLGIDASTTATILCALGIIAVATAINFGGTKVLAKAAIVGFVAEIGGAVVVGVWLLLAHREQPLSILFDSFGAGGSQPYAYAFLAAGLIGIFQYYGFEACGDVAEEVADPGRLIPKAMRMTIYVGGAAATFVCLALLLAVPDVGAVISGEDVDPVSTILLGGFGQRGYQLVLAVVLISFLSCVMSLQAAASRLAYSYARDEMIIGSRLLSHFSPERRVPPYALLMAAVVPTVIVVGSIVSADALTSIVSFAALGIYVGFQMVVLAALRARLKGWVPSGPFTLGRWGVAINVAALAYGVGAIVNMSWPRTPDASWYDNWIVALSGLVVVALGLAYLFAANPHERSDAPSSDAVGAGPSAPAPTVPR